MRERGGEEEERKGRDEGEGRRRGGKKGER